MIDFYIIDEPTQPILSNYKEDKYQAWVFLGIILFAKSVLMQRIFVIHLGIHQINGVNTI